MIEQQRGGGGLKLLLNFLIFDNDHRFIHLCTIYYKIHMQVKAGLSMQWQRNLPKFYNILVDHAIRTFPAIR